MHPWKRALTAPLLLLTLGCEGRDSGSDIDLIDLARSDRAAFARHLAEGAGSDYQRTLQIVDWLARNFDWKATDYENRTVDEILDRGGGNCAELALVAQALFDDLGIRRRRIVEINAHVISETRQRSAEAKVDEIGLRASVFGRGHNDHVWLEVFDDTSGEWLPADPSLGVVGLEPWLKARAWFGDRTTLDPTSDDMLFPIGIFVLDEDRALLENRTRHYMVDSLDALYGSRLSGLESWAEWVEALDAVDDLCLEAFQGTSNLHTHQAEIDRARAAYLRLKTDYSSTTAATAQS